MFRLKAACRLVANFFQKLLKATNTESLWCEEQSYNLIHWPPPGIKQHRKNGNQDSLLLKECGRLTMTTRHLQSDCVSQNWIFYTFWIAFQLMKFKGVLHT